MKKTLLILLFLPIIGHTQGVKNIYSISDARMPLYDHGYTLDGLMMNMSSTNKVLSADNFGPTGTYSQSFSIISGYSTSNSLAAITSNSNIDLFFFGGFDKNNPSLIPFTNAELDSLHKWSMNGGKMIIGASATPSASPQNNSILNAKWDFNLIEDPNAVIVPSSSGLSSSIFDGPFGYNLSSLQNMWANQGGSIRGYFNIIPSNSIVLAEDWIGNPTLILDCKTLDLIVADVDAYTTLGNISNGPLISTRNDTLWANTIVYMDMLQSQPVISLIGNILSTTALYSSYQWFKDSIAIMGANSPSHNTLAQVGSYHVGANLDCGCNNVASNTIIVGAVDGCTDPTACNYDSGANTDDGSCIYPSLITTTITTCDSYVWIDGNTYTTNNNTATFNFVGGAASGCDSIVSLNLIITNNYTSSDTIVNYVSNVEFQSNSPKTYLESIDSTLSTNGGCDSIVLNYINYVFNPNNCTNTTFITNYDTTFITVFDSVLVIDSISIYDTSFVTYYDTNYFTIYDTITYYDSVLVSVTDTLIVNVNLSGISSPNNSNTLKIYPNPSNDVVFIDNGNFNSMSNYILKIINSLGQDVFNSFITIPQFQIPITSFGGVGLYYIQLYDNTGNLVEIRKLIIQ